MLGSLFYDITTLSGVGNRIRELIEQRLGTRVIDAVFYLPSGFVDRRSMPPISEVKEGQIFTAEVTIDKHIAGYRRRNQPYKVACSNDSGKLNIVFFNMPSRNYLEEQLPLEAVRIISGRAEFYKDKLQMPHPDYIAPLEKLEEIRKLETTYPLTYGISQKVMGKIIRAAIVKLPDLPEWIDKEYKKQKKWQSWKNTLEKIHSPDSTESFLPSFPARERVAYDELLANQLALALSRKATKKQRGRKIAGDGELTKKLVDSLPWQLTDGQREVIKDIFKDMKSENRMLRLLQGDVGSGKTVVALLAMLNTVEAGKQAAIMAPTEILSSQHIKWIEQAIKTAEINVSVERLTGSIKGKRRENILRRLKSGEIDIIIGTHALFQEQVIFKDLAMIVIDEQHRFGVRQRLTLAEKGNKTDILLMTATPIPRTLTLTLYGDMEISSLKEKPAGRIAIDTRIIAESRIDEIAERLKQAIKDGDRAYWVCPLIERPEDGDNEEIQLAAAETRFRYLQKIFKIRAGLVHGKMKAEEKEKAMLAFKNGDIDVLVATTVIEVGVDVAEATIMIVEHAEQFGLSQLHQLRGRVGRMDKPSKCILLYSENIGNMGKRRLNVMRETDDGFRIAEEDLVLRGSGELLGTKQSGMPEFKLAVLPDHSELLFAARDDVKIILETDPKLNSQRGKALRTLLRLFEYDSHIKYLRS